MVQTVEIGGDSAKHLCHLLQMEEQWLHARQICQVNQMARSSGSILAVSMVNPNGTISHHSNKVAMEAACLEEAKAHFMQANNTPS